jgi:hypothetical protein
LTDAKSGVRAFQDGFPVDQLCKPLAVLAQPLDASHVVTRNVILQCNVESVEEHLRKVPPGDLGLMFPWGLEQLL